MLSRTRQASAAGAILALTLLGLSCSGSDSVTNPSPAMPAASANIAGTWTGTIQSDVQACSGSPVTATLEQHGSDVKGTLAADKCGIHGGFFGTLSGSSLTGRVEMSGCTGGVVLGSANASTVTMSIGDFWRQATSGDEVIMPGGAVTFHR